MDGDFIDPSVLTDLHTVATPPVAPARAAPSTFPVVTAQQQAARNADQLGILQTERAKLTDPNDLAEIDKEIANVSRAQQSGKPFSATTKGQAPVARAPALAAPANQFISDDVLNDLQSATKPVVAPPSKPAAAATPAPQEPKGALAGGLEAARSALGVQEPLAQAASSMVAGPIAGLAGLATEAYDQITGHPGTRSGDVVNKVSDALTYHPQTPVGQALSNAQNKPFELLGQGANYVGEKTAEATGSPLAGALANTAIQAAPMLVGAKNPLAETARGIADRVEPTIGGRAAPAPSTLGDLGQAPQGVRPAPVPGISTPGTPTAAPEVPLRADGQPKYFPTLQDASPQMQAAVAEEVKASGGRPNGDAIGRHVEADTLPSPVKLVEGQASGDVDLAARQWNARNEDPELLATYESQNPALVKNFDLIKSQVAPDVNYESATDLGQQHVDAYKAMDAARQADIRSKYQALADANGGELPVDASGLLGNIKSALAKQFKGRYLPSDLASDIEEFVQPGNATVQNLENIRTNMAAAARKAERAGDGNAAAAIHIARDQVEQMPVTGDSLQVKTLADEARSAARSRFESINADPAYKAVVNDAPGLGEPSPLADTFMQKYVTAKSAPLANIRTMLDNLSSDPLAKQRMAAAIQDSLKSSAGIDLRTNAGEFGQSSFNKALTVMSPKMEWLYDPKSERQMYQLGNVGRYVKERNPVGVFNHSNTAPATVSLAKTVAAKGAVGLGNLTGAALLGPGGAVAGSLVGAGVKMVGEARAARAADAAEAAHKADLRAATRPGAGIRRVPKQDQMQ